MPLNSAYQGLRKSYDSALQRRICHGQGIELRSNHIADFRPCNPRHGFGNVLHQIGSDQRMVLRAQQNGFQVKLDGVGNRLFAVSLHLNRRLLAKYQQQQWHPV